MERNINGKFWRFFVDFPVPLNGVNIILKTILFSWSVEQKINKRLCWFSVAFPHPKYLSLILIKFWLTFRHTSVTCRHFPVTYECWHLRWHKFAGRSTESCLKCLTHFCLNALFSPTPINDKMLLISCTLLQSSIPPALHSAGTSGMHFFLFLYLYFPIGLQSVAHHSLKILVIYLYIHMDVSFVPIKI